jgi:cobalt/nickel transport system permease protein
MLIERCAHGNRWRRVDPGAKGLFACCGLIAAFMAERPLVPCAMALAIACITVAGAGIRLRDYLRALLPPLFFLAVGSVTLAFSLHWAGEPVRLHLHLERSQLPHIALVCGRSLNGLAALLFLSLTTPLTDTITLLRRLRTPEALLDIMVLCYRTLFVLAEAVRDTITAQSARLGYATVPLSLRSLGLLVANLSLQVWQRSRALHLAAQARNNDGPLCFLENEYTGGSSILLASVGGGALLVVSMMLGGEFQ